LIEIQKDFEKESEATSLNNLAVNQKGAVGVMAFGIAYNYLMENISTEKKTTIFLK
jgi:TPP-dependent indolepyruvate ferredoxin oxidoreductase alpha subunit